MIADYSAEIKITIFKKIARFNSVNYNVIGRKFTEFRYDVARLLPLNHLKLDYKLSLEWAWSWSRDVFKFSEISDNISETVQDRDIVTMEDK